MSIIRAIVFSNIWIAIGAAAYAWHTYLFVGILPNWYFIALVFFATLFSYNFQRLIRLDIIENKTSKRLTWIERHKVELKLLTAFSFVFAGVWAMFELSLIELFLAFPTLVLVVFYASFFTKNKKRGIRDIPFIKIFVIAGVWAFVLGAFPLLKTHPYREVLTVFLDKFCFILAITIPFDIRDLAYDASSKKTLPMLAGVVGAKAIALVALVVSFAINVFAPTNIISLSVFYLVAALLIGFSSQKRQELYYTGLIDGLLVVSPVVFF